MKYNEKLKVTGVPTGRLLNNYGIQNFQVTKPSSNSSQHQIYTTGGVSSPQYMPLKRIRQISQDPKDFQKRPKMSLNLGNENADQSRQIFQPGYATTASPFIYNPVGSQTIPEKSPPFNLPGSLNQVRSPQGKFLTMKFNINYQID